MSAGKADFSDVYARPDPRGYYEALGALGYQIPEHGAEVFALLVDELRPVVDGTPRLLDVCCSYGVNAALINHDVTMDDITAHYAAASELDRAGVLAEDREFLDPLLRDDAVDVVGLDISGPAIAYAVESGLLVDGVVADLETEDLRPEDAAKLADVDLITVTGGIGYVQERTFDQVLDAVEGEPPWIAALSLRWVDIDPVLDTFADHGLETESLPSFVVPQRRFADLDEQRFVLDELAARDVDPTGAEADGHHCAELYVARPPELVAARPLAEVLSSLSG